MMAIATDNANLPTTASENGGGSATLRAAFVTVGLLWTPHHGTAGTYLIEKPAVRTATSPDDHRFANASAETTGEALLEIRRRSGLTWEELADLFCVSRRSVHHWASGKAVAAEHDQHIRRALAIIRQLDRGEAKQTRDSLLTPRTDGVLAFDLLKRGAFDDALASGGVVPQQIRTSLTALSLEALHIRRPPRPAELIAALNDRPAMPTTARLARTFRAPKVT
jgi:transcriptional regulator with XRE-family HTH domain